MTPLLEPQPAEQESGFPWGAIAAGGLLVVLAVGAIWLFTHKPPAASGEVAESPYAKSLEFTGLKLATAQNFVGASVYYVEGRVANRGPQTLTRILVQVTFRDTLGQVVQQERVPVMVLEERPGYYDPVDLSLLPLAPGQAREFRFTFEHISGEWNQALPELKVLSVQTK